VTTAPWEPCAAAHCNGRVCMSLLFLNVKLTTVVISRVWVMAFLFSLGLFGFF